MTNNGKIVPWLLLMFSLPAESASRRTEVWRKLRRYGALPLKGSGYLLPGTPANEERFQWLASEIRKAKGEASIIAAHAIDNLPFEELVRWFNQARSKEYETLMQDLQRAIKRAKGQPLPVSRYRKRLQEIAERDFFHHPLRSRAEALVVRASGREPAPSSTGRRRKGFTGRTWVTRPRPGIDRVSSAWLIRTFIDPTATFVFADDPARHPKAIPFDMFSEQGFGHRGDQCTFETLAREFGLSDERLQTIAQIVHDADFADEKFGRTEGAGIERILIGWAHQGISDDELLRRGMELVEGVYRSL